MENEKLLAFAASIEPGQLYTVGRATSNSYLDIPKNGQCQKLKGEQVY